VAAGGAANCFDTPRQGGGRRRMPHAARPGRGAKDVVKERLCMVTTVEAARAIVWGGGHPFACFLPAATQLTC
jgi:hypothetical protein